MTQKWSPADAELDAVARSLSPPAQSTDRIEQARTSLLAQAAGIAQHERSSRAPVVAALAMTFAAAAAVLIWFVVRPSDSIAPPKEVITAIGAARYERTSAWPDFGVRVDEGSVSIQVGALDDSERFRATTSDAVIEARGAKLIVGARDKRVTFVSVTEGRAEIRWREQAHVIVSAGQTWLPPLIAQREMIELTPPVAAPAIATAPQPKKPARSPAKAVTKTAPVADEVSKTSDVVKPQPQVPASNAVVKPQPPRPGEADFRAGVAALRAGDATAAAKSFAAACTAARTNALGEDACFWVGAAAKRAGDRAAARDALTRFLAAFPTSARSGEASALLGWILYDAGELDAAKARFEIAVRDRVPKVQQSAARGLEAIERKRASR